MDINFGYLSEVLDVVKIQWLSWQNIDVNVFNINSDLSDKCVWSQYQGEKSTTSKYP